MQKSDAASWDAQRRRILAAFDAPTEDSGRKRDAETRESSTSAPPPDDSVPGYTFLKEIHRGGQGVVYQAIQKSTKRKVAIKLMRDGPFAGAADRARFEREVQILGQLSHPNIVAIHDSGVANGNFYFVMDYVPGETLDAHMSSGERTIDDALRLFAKICDAVNAAHVLGVIHRDLKPGNVRVDPQGEPRVLDFGLAKSMAGIGEPAMTMTGQFIGSVPWSAPEQAEGQPGKTDTRTDVYALGVVLYQMLTGDFPYPVTGSLHDVLQNIREAPPIPPARAWSTTTGVAAQAGRTIDASSASARAVVANNRRSSAASWLRRPFACPIDNEVETIVLKCLSKERERRYQNAGELARDIQHYLVGEPIEAKRDSALYVLRKLVTRNRVPVAAAGFVLAVILASTVWLGALYRQQFDLREAADKAGVVAANERDTARAEAKKALAAGEITERILAASNAALEGEHAHAVDLLDMAAKGFDEGFKNDPELEATVRNRLGLSYRALGRLDPADREFRAALDIRERLYGPDHPDTIRLRSNVGTLLFDQGRLAEAEPILRAALSSATRVMGRSSKDTLTIMDLLASALVSLRQLDEAESLYRRRVAAIDLNDLELDDRTIRTMNNFASLLITRLKLADAEKLLDELEPAADRTLAENATMRVQILGNRASLLFWQGKLSESVRFYQKAIALAGQLYDESHPDVLRINTQMCRVLVELARWDDAESILTNTIAMQKRQGRDDHPDTLLAEVDRAALYLHSGRVDQSAERLPDLVSRCKSVLGERNVVTLLASFEYANLLLQQGHIDRAEGVCRRTLELRTDTQVYGPSHPQTLRSLHQLARIQRAQHRWTDATSNLDQALEIAQRLLPAGHYLTAIIRMELGACEVDTQRSDDAERNLLTAHRDLAAALGPGHPRTRAAAAEIAVLYDRWGRPDDANNWRISGQ